MANYRRKKGSVVGKIFAGIGIALLIALVVAVICYFANPDFKVAVNNGFQEIGNFFKNMGNKAETETTTSAYKMIIR